MDKKTFYISTAIAYASAKPHIGNTYEIVLADAIARYKREMGYDVYFQTGTDEHGEKVENESKEAGITPQEYVDNVSNIIKEVFDSMNVTYDNFVRTSNREHKRKVQDMFKYFYDKGDIYKDEYTGLYCTPCESFWTESQLVDGMCPDCGREVSPRSEEAYFFKMSKYSKWLEDYINEHPDFIQPESRKNEIMNNFIIPGLQDLCVSRTSVKWGVPVTFDENHVIYVWIDALSNYITFPGFEVDGNHQDNFKKYWPADIQLIGKDILRFHTIYWPIMLHSLGVELPKTIFGHPWLLFGNDKMSKSKGNITYADELASEFGIDAVRYYMLHEIPFASDGNFTLELFIERINSDLANVLGNLVQRTISMSKKYFDGSTNSRIEVEDIDNELKELVLSTPDKVDKYMNEYKILEALDSVMEIFRRSNKYIDETEPWVLAKDDTKQDRLKTVLYNLLESIRCGAILLRPFLPETSDNILNQLNTNNKSFDSITFDGLETNLELNDPTPLFIRIDKDKYLSE